MAGQLQQSQGLQQPQVGPSFAEKLMEEHQMTPATAQMRESQKGYLETDAISRLLQPYVRFGAKYAPQILPYFYVHFNI